MVPTPPRGPIAFVTPRYGAGVVGGAETVAAEAAAGLASRGWPVEVLTTCATDHYTWRNELAPGTSRAGDVTVRRFPVARRRGDARRRGELEARLQAGDRLPYDQQVAWLNAGLRVPALFHHLLAGPRYRAVVFSPYLFWTTVVGATAVPGRAVVMPCLHDEPYAYLDVVRPALAGAAAVWFLSEPERDLANRLGPVAGHQVVVGAGVRPPARYDPDGFRARHGLHRPFLLYAGRREAGKGWPWLLDAYDFSTRVVEAPLDLVSMGVGKADIPPHLAGRVHDLGVVADRDRDDACAAAAAYVQPSRNESFSRTVMEAWLAGTPVLAHAASLVVAWHCERSQAGVTFADEFELAACLAFLA
ncbi:MAG: glycosyltransferase, partial [Acidimicrobiales bacterium]